MYIKETFPLTYPHLRCGKSKPRNQLRLLRDSPEDRTLPADTEETPKSGHMAHALRDATAQPSSPQQAGLYCISQKDGGELWIAWDGAHVLGSATTYRGDDLGPIVERLGRLA